MKEAVEAEDGEHEAKQDAGDESGNLHERFSFAWGCAAETRRKSCTMIVD
jgi:hypothetical protein